MALSEAAARLVCFERDQEEPMGSSSRTLTSIEICAGAGGQAVGLHEAKFRHLALVEIDKHACETLRANIARDKEEWGDCEVLVEDVAKEFKPFRLMAALDGRRSLVPGELDLLAGGVPCPPFSVAGKQLGQDDERDLFPRMLELVELLQPKAVMIENVRGILDAKFARYREDFIGKKLDEAGYEICKWDLLEAREFGVPQLRPRAILVAIDRNVLERAKLEGVKFEWPTATVTEDVTVVEKLDETMQERLRLLKEEFPHFAERAETAYQTWLEKATKAKNVAPTLVGGSKKHGGADLGPSRAKAAWGALGVNGLGVANDPQRCNPERDFLRKTGPMLTVEQAAIIQGFPRKWKFEGGKTARYRQVGNAFPPPVAEAVGRAIAEVLYAALREGSDRTQLRDTSEPSARVESNTAVADDSADHKGALVS
jgi:DNA (cytosine-5)-methyltransferase 1